MSESVDVKYDSVDGYEAITEALRMLVDKYPALERGEHFQFSMLGDYGAAIFPTTGSVVQSEVESITGHCTQMCTYPFTVVYRVSGLSQGRKANTKEWLDDFGRWMERQPIMVGSDTYKISEYPVLKGGTREIRNIYRQTPAYLATVNQDKSEDWYMNMIIQYRNEFDK